jgi:coenzyme F420-reducing hydrogenase delta subunit
MHALRRDLERAIGDLRGETKIIVFGCECAADVTTHAAPDTATLPLPCTAMLPPSFVEYALRAGADGALITGCRDGDCEFRLGNRWTEERMAAAREPHLRSAVPRQRVRIAWAGAIDQAALAAELAVFRSTLRALPASERARRTPPKRTETLHG